MSSILFRGAFGPWAFLRRPWVFHLELDMVKLGKRGNLSHPPTIALALPRLSVNKRHYS